ncbi:hypothetical protein PCASD_02647 [Puccinia coronata f. sp. avenae]|uniref:Uncharacterized protein n=1 Tax=Puccinia coronata f. sp. avenae TaxID=200324 RepID=A0A2N5VH69_9BASI|nr:hypothetical protein PCASD_02647 [Puccinia coronata f. sp. avenae]
MGGFSWGKHNLQGLNPQPSPHTTCKQQALMQKRPPVTFTCHMCATELDVSRWSLTTLGRHAWLQPACQLMSPEDAFQKASTIYSVSTGRSTQKASTGRFLEVSSGRFDIEAPVGLFFKASNGRYLTELPTGRFMVASNGRLCQVAPTGLLHRGSNGCLQHKVPTGRSGSHRPTGTSPRLRPADPLEASVGRFYQKASSGQVGF